MGKALNFIVAAAAAAVTFVATGGNVAAAQLAFTATLAVLSVLNPGRASKPPTAESAQKQSIPPRVFAYGRRRLHPYFALYETADNGTSVDVYAFADGQAQQIEHAYINDEKITLSGNVVQSLEDGKFGGGNVKAGWTLGNATNTAFSNIVALLPGIWTSAHRGDGVVTGYLTKAPVSEKNFAKRYPQGDAATLSLVGKWQLCFDPRSNTTDWTENPVLHLLHYLTVRRGYDYDTRIAPTLNYWINAADICDEPVALKGGGSEPRYRSCVSYLATAKPKEVIGSLLETFDGWIAPRGDGAIVIYAGKLYQPTVTIGPDEIHSMNFKLNVEQENTIDQIAVSYISEEHDWNEVEAEPWGGENGVISSDSIDPQSPSASQNRRLAKRKMAQINAPKSGTITTNLGGRKARGQRYIYLDAAEGDFDPLLGVQVVEITSLTRNMATGGVSFEWILTDLTIDEWNPDQEEGNTPAAGAGVVRTALAAPMILSTTREYGQNPAYNTPGVKLNLTVSGPNRADLTWYVRTRVAGTQVWLEQEYPEIAPGDSVLLQTDFLPLADIEAQVSYKVGDGRVSPWSASANVDTGNVLPDALTGLGVTTNADKTIIACDWDDTRYATRYQVQVIPFIPQPYFIFTGNALPTGATYTRASPATDVLADGSIAMFANDVPRIDSRGILIEPARTNLLVSSGDLTGSGWMNAGSPMIAGGQADPAGGMAGTLVTHSSDGYQGRYQALSGVMSSAIYAASIFVKQGATNPATTNRLTTNNTQAFASGMTIALALTNAWKRVMGVGTLSDTSVANFFGSANFGQSPTIETDTSGSRVLFGAQLERVLSGERQEVSSYIPTLGSAATRAADDFKLPWGAQGVADGPIAIRYTFTDGTTQDVAATVSGGMATVPTNLNRARIARADKV